MLLWSGGLVELVVAWRLGVGRENGFLSLSLTSLAEVTCERNVRERLTSPRKKIRLFVKGNSACYKSLACEVYTNNRLR